MHALIANLSPAKSRVVKTTNLSSYRLVLPQSVVIINKILDSMIQKL